MSVHSSIEDISEWLDDVDIANAERKAEKQIKQIAAFGIEHDADADHATCLHEAAHAIIGRELGRSVLRASVCSTGVGAVEFGNDGCDMAKAVSCLAGPAIEILAGEAGECRKVAMKASFDVLEARRIIDGINSRHSTPFITNRAAAMLAGSLVQLHRKAIERLAEVLQRKGEASAAEIAAI